MKTEEVRHMLASYYDGTATCDEVDALKRYFVEADSVPDDLKADAAVFRALASCESARVPGDLGQRIIDSTVGSRRPARFVARRVIAVAASVALIISLGLAFLNDSPAGAPLDTAPADTMAQRYVAEVDTEALQVTEVVTTQPEMIAVETVAPDDATAGRYTELTDSAAVVEMTMRIMADFETTMEKARLSMRHTEMALAMLRDPLKANDIRKLYD